MCVDLAAGESFSVHHREPTGRQAAGMFVTFLRGSDTPGLARTMNAILEGHRFFEAANVGYQQDLQSL